MSGKRPYQAVVVGASAGGMRVLQEILQWLPADFPVPVVVVLHVHPHSDGVHLVRYLSRKCALRVKVADEKEPVEAGTIYLAPANYHLLVEADHHLSLSIDEKVNFSRPAVDVLFESAAEAYRGELVGIVLTGSSQDGAAGLARIKACGGLAIVQAPATAEATTMPESALRCCEVDLVLAPAKIGVLLKESVHNGELWL